MFSANDRSPSVSALRITAASSLHLKLGSCTLSACAPPPRRFHASFGSRSGASATQCGFTDEHTPTDSPTPTSLSNSAVDDARHSQRSCSGSGSAFVTTYGAASVMRIASALSGVAAVALRILTLSNCTATATKKSSAFGFVSSLCGQRSWYIGTNTDAPSARMSAAPVATRGASRPSPARTAREKPCDAASPAIGAGRTASEPYAYTSSGTLTLFCGISTCDHTRSLPSSPRAPAGSVTLGGSSPRSSSGTAMSFRTASGDDSVAILPSPPCSSVRSSSCASTAAVAPHSATR
jgi:hypothetical protein